MDTETEATETVRFRADGLARFAEGMAKLRKVSDKLNVPPMDYEIIGRDTETRTETMPNGKRYTYEISFVTVAVSGTSPVLAGDWQYVGTIEHADAGNMIHGNDPALAAYRTAAANCDHCGYRRNRSKTMILRNAAGEIAQVGTACLKDFLGYHGNADRLAWLCDLSLEELAREASEDGGYGYLSRDGGVLTTAFLAVVCACVRSHGWQARSGAEYARQMPTADLAAYVLGVRNVDRRDDDLRAMVRAIEITADDVAQSEKVREWSQTIPADTENNYLGNVRVSLASEYVSPKHFGIGASAVSAMRKATEREEQRQVRNAERAASVFVGTVGKRETFTVSVVFVRAIDGDYGTTYLVDMRDDHGNVLKTFASGSFGYNAETGDRYEIKATVKNHETYNGTNQTVLTRCTVVTDLTEHAEIPCGTPTDHAYSRCTCVS